ncbi:MAG: 16S rRNA (adenine(1518)-N(6)/adenine(1519)-N(6))-dimethyltransferase RsmA [Myxococcota bacterium]
MSTLRPEKALGQHFLRDPEVLADIAAIADGKHSGGILEIGPGEGALTAFLVEAGVPLVAIDKDPRALAAIAERFGGRVRGVLGDAATDDLGALLPGPGAVIVGNLPYNAASAIHRRVLALGTRVARAVLMFQREVALRLVAGPGSREYGIPSILTAVAARSWMVRDVPPQAFTPPPKVQSAVVLVEPLATPLVAPADLEAFAAFLGTVFQQRRKTLANALGAKRHALEAVGIDGRLRAEQVGPEAFIRLWRASLD